MDHTPEQSRDQGRDAEEEACGENGFSALPSAAKVRLLQAAQNAQPQYDSKTGSNQQPDWNGDKAKHRSTEVITTRNFDGK